MKLDIGTLSVQHTKTVISVPDTASVSVSKAKIDNVGTFLERRPTNEIVRSKCLGSNNKSNRNDNTTVGWSSRYDQNFQQAFAKDNSKVAIQIEDNEISNVGIVYKGTDQGGISIKRNKMTDIGIVALTAPSGTLLADGKHIIELPLSGNFTKDDLNDLIAII